MCARSHTRSETLAGQRASSSLRLDSRAALRPSHNMKASRRFTLTGNQPLLISEVQFLEKVVIGGSAAVVVTPIVTAEGYLTEG
jgi:hypothetical protein